MIRMILDLDALQCPLDWEGRLGGTHFPFKELVCSCSKYAIKFSLKENKKTNLQGPLDWKGRLGGTHFPFNDERTCRQLLKIILSFALLSFSFETPSLFFYVAKGN